MESASFGEQDSAGRVARGRLEFSGAAKHLARLRCERASATPLLQCPFDSSENIFPLHPRPSFRHQTTEHAHVNILQQAWRQTERLNFSGLPKRPLSPSRQRRGGGGSTRVSRRFSRSRGHQICKTPLFPPPSCSNDQLEPYLTQLRDNKQKNERKVVNPPSKDSKKRVFGVKLAVFPAISTFSARFRASMCKW